MANGVVDYTTKIVLLSSRMCLRLFSSDYIQAAHGSDVLTSFSCVLL